MSLLWSDEDIREDMRGDVGDDSSPTCDRCGGPIQRQAHAVNGEMWCEACYHLATTCDGCGKILGPGSVEIWRRSDTRDEWTEMYCAECVAQERTS